MSIPRNPARTGGPKTAAGRALIAGNALKTGAYAAQVVLPWEDAAEFSALHAQLVQDFEPVGMAEQAMVQDLAALTWKKMRIDRVENAVMTQFGLLPLTLERLTNAYGPDFEAGAMPRLVPRYEPVTQQEFDSATAVLAGAQALRGQPASQTQGKAVRRQWPDLYQALDTWAADYCLGADDLLDGTNPEPGTPVLGDALNEISAANQPLIWLWHNRTRVEAALRRAQDSRLLQYMKVENTQRAYEDTGRAFYRTLAELRKQQDWRIRRSAIDIQDVSTLPPPGEP